MLRLAVPREVIGRSDHHIALRAAERDRDHVLREMLAIAHAGIEARADDVDERAFGDDLEIDLRIGLEERRDHRRQHEIDRRRRRVDAQPARGHFAQAADLIQGVADIAHRRRHARQQQFARLGQRDAAGGAVHQANAEPLLQVPQSLAKARHRHANLDRRAPEIAGAGHRHEGIEIAQVEIGHCSL